MSKNSDNIDIEYDMSAGYGYFQYCVHYCYSRHSMHVFETSVLIGDQDCHISIHWTGGGYFSQLRCKLRFGEITSIITA